MSWNFFDRIDVGTMARTGDVESIESLMWVIIFTSVTTDHARLFGSRAALHVFLVLRMSVEVLLLKLKRISTAIPPAPGQAAQHERRIELLNRGVRLRDLIITPFMERLKMAEQARDGAATSI
jgi:hypothetical protein